MPRYLFSDFILSPRRRVLLRNGIEQPLIPRYFDLLVFLVERRRDAVHRRDIFDAVWTDVIVSDSALSQAIRTIRRVLGDDSREPRFVRTVSRHGYQFVFDAVIEENDDDLVSIEAAPPTPAPAPVPDAFTTLLDRITHPPADPAEEEDQRDAAERLHTLGTAEALKRLPVVENPAFARALLRDTRWDTPEAGPVPILGEPGAAAVSLALVQLRLRRVAAIAAARWASGSSGGALSGAIGGCVGGVLLLLAPGSATTPAVVPVLATIGLMCGMLAGAGIAAGLAVAESIARSQRTIAIVVGGAAGGGLVGLAIQLLGYWSLDVLVGVTPQIGGGGEGLVIGGAASLGYALGTGRVAGGLAAPRGRERRRVMWLTASACALAALILSVAGRPLVGGTIHAIAQAAASSQALLSPLGRIIGEPGFGRITAALIAMGEGWTFGCGLSWGLTRRQ
ncbi:MAG TPA: winged helix-turn-helix domain-containing protein [Vicinamibacterales bacterium]|nr:winged helix-turn-helix domain-containing protein [Vicinamibacterales bacterium]